MCAKKNKYDEEELFAHTRMSLGDHIEELRSHLWKAILGFCIAIILGFVVAQPCLEFLIKPLHTVFAKMEIKRLNEELTEIDKIQGQSTEVRFVNKRDLLRSLGLPYEAVDPSEQIELPLSANRSAIRKWQIQERIKEIEEKGVRDVLVFMGITEPFMIWVKVSMYAGFVLASPWIFYQIWSFIAAGLYPHEKKYIHIFLPMSIGLFLAGVSLCQFVVLPIGIEWLLKFSTWVGVKPELQLSEWLGFALMVPLIFGIAFQLPLVMFGLERIGILSVETYKAKRRIAIFILFVIAGIGSAAPDPISMLLLATPLCFLYEFGIILCKMWPKETVDLDVEETEESVEV